MIFASSIFAIFPLHILPYQYNCGDANGVDKDAVLLINTRECEYGRKYHFHWP